MKYFIDTEFHERRVYGYNTIELISIGIVSEDGKEFYAISNDFDLTAAQRNQWLNDNVIAKLDSSDWWQSNDDIKKKIIAFIGDDEYPSFYGYFCDYDWVVFCWLFGRMIDLPKNFPMFCIDLKQMMVERQLGKAWKKENCPDPEGEHNALVDAKWNKKLYEVILNSEPTPERSVARKDQ